MARYLYACANGHELIIVRPMTADKVPVVCPCGAVAERTFTAPAVHWGGFPRPSHDEQPPGFKRWVAGAQERREQYQEAKPAHEAAQAAAEKIDDGS